MYTNTKGMKLASHRLKHILKDATPHFCQIENEVVFDRAPMYLHKTVIEYCLSLQVICENSEHICIPCKVSFYGQCGIGGLATCVPRRTPWLVYYEHRLTSSRETGRCASARSVLYVEFL